MATILLDTHVFAWITSEPARLTVAARQMLELADGLCMSTVSLYEIAQKVRLGKWAAMSPDVDSLDRAAEDIDIDLVPVNSQIAITAGLLDWSHRDPFDRIIAATAITLDLGLISADTAFDTLPLRRVW